MEIMKGSENHYPKVLKFGHVEIINFPFVPNGKLNIFRCSKI